MEGSETLFCSSNIPLAHKKSFWKFTDNSVMRQRKGSLAMHLGLLRHKTNSRFS